MSQADDRRTRARCKTTWVEPMDGDTVRCVRPFGHSGDHQYLVSRIPPDEQESARVTEDSVTEATAERQAILNEVVTMLYKVRNRGWDSDRDRDTFDVIAEEVRIMAAQPSAPVADTETPPRDLMHDLMVSWGIDDPKPTEGKP